MEYLTIFFVACIEVALVAICLPIFRMAYDEWQYGTIDDDEWPVKLVKTEQDLINEDAEQDCAIYPVCNDLSDHGLAQVVFKICELQEQAFYASDEAQRRYVERDLAAQYDELLDLTLVRLPEEQIPERFLYHKNKG